MPVTAVLGKRKDRATQGVAHERGGAHGEAQVDEVRRTCLVREQRVKRGHLTRDDGNEERAPLGQNRRDEKTAVGAPKLFGARVSRDDRKRYDWQYGCRGLVEAHVARALILARG